MVVTVDIWLLATIGFAILLVGIVIGVSLFRAK